MLSAFICVFLNAQTQVADSVMFRFHFRQGKSQLDLAYRDNRHQLDVLADTLRGIISDSGREILSINIEGSASPEGTDAINASLALNRARVLRSLLLRSVGGGINNELFKAYSLGVDWIRLAALIRDSGLPNKEVLNDIITKNLHRPSGDIVAKIKDLDNGASWRVLNARIFPELRQSSASVIVYVRPALEPAVPEKEIVVQHDTVTVFNRDTLVLHSRDTVYIPSSRGVEESSYTLGWRRKMVVAMRTNLLLPLLNIGVEIPIGNRWSVGLDWYYPWHWRQWHKQTEMKYCAEMLFGGVDVRYWFGDRHSAGEENWQYRLFGHSIGLYGNGGYYDFGRDYSGWQGAFSNVGLDYQYSFRIGKKRDMRLEMSLGIGWIHSNAQKYKVYTEGGHAYRTGVRQSVNWFGPTKATVSLVIPIYKTVKKEGER